MKLTTKQIESIARGAARVEEHDGRTYLYRFTKEQEEAYKGYNEGFYNKTFSTPGIKLRFKTDSRSLSMKIAVSKGKMATSRKYFSVDVFVNGKMIGALDNFSDIELPKAYAEINVPDGEFSKKFDLGGGEKSVCVHMPFSVCPEIEEISVDDGAFIKPESLPKKILMFGDSITHGYDALRPSNRYAARLAEALSAEEYNKAIGGEKFFPTLATLRDDFTPDYITVAYGTNDWSGRGREEVRGKCREFYLNLRKTYPDTKIFAITPIWRKDMNADKKYGEFRLVSEDIKELTADIENVICIDGSDFVPKSPDMFADLRLHPNDTGFEHYFNNLYAEISKHI